MALSKKEISILIEVVFSILFALIFMPFFYENQGDNLISINNLIGKITPIIIFAVLYFSMAYAVLELIFKAETTVDERDDMINSKSYKLGYLLYELSLFVFIGMLLTNSILQNTGGIIFLIISYCNFYTFNHTISYICTEPFKMVLKNNLKEFRHKNNLTQDDLGKSVGVSRQTIISIERYRYKPSLELAMKMAKELNVKIEKLFYFD